MRISDWSSDVCSSDLSAILMLVLAYGISMDVEDLAFAVLDRDQTTTSQNYALDISGSRYFIEQPPIIDYADLDRRMRAGERSEERRVGQECVSTCRSRWSPDS